MATKKELAAEIIEVLGEEIGTVEELVEKNSHAELEVILSNAKEAKESEESAHEVQEDESIQADGVECDLPAGTIIEPSPKSDVEKSEWVVLDAVAGRGKVYEAGRKVKVDSFAGGKETIDYLLKIGIIE